MHLLPALPSRPDDGQQTGPQARPGTPDPLQPGDHVVYRRPVAHLAGDDKATGVGWISSTDSALNRYTVVDVRTRACFTVAREFLRLIPAEEIMRDIDEDLAARGYRS